MSGFVTFFGYRVARCHLSPRLREGLCLKAWLLPRDASSVMVFADAVGKVCGAALCWEAELAGEEAVAINAEKVCLFHMHSSGFKALFRQPHSSRSAVKSSGFFFFPATPEPRRETAFLQTLLICPHTRTCPNCAAGPRAREAKLHYFILYFILF